MNIHIKFIFACFCIVNAQENVQNLTVVDSSNNIDTTKMATELEELVSKDNSGYGFGLTASSGFINGAYITNTPVGGSVVISTPFSYDTGKLNLTLSLVLGSYNGEGNNEPLNALLFGIGANASLFKMIFSETHIGSIGSGLGLRNFSGISFEQLFSKKLDLPFNILIGGEGFIAAKADDITENSTYWGGLGIRLNFDL